MLDIRKRRAGDQLNRVEIIPCPIKSERVGDGRGAGAAALGAASAAAVELGVASGEDVVQQRSVAAGGELDVRGVGGIASAVG